MSSNSMTTFQSTQVYLGTLKKEAAFGFSVGFYPVQRTISEFTFPLIIPFTPGKSCRGFVQKSFFLAEESKLSTAMED